MGSLLREVLVDMKESGVKTYISFAPPYPPYTYMFKEFAMLRNGEAYVSGIVDQSLLFAVSVLRAFLFLMLFFLVWKRTCIGHG